jgi:Gpi18-like mannosyltransferase
MIPRSTSGTWRLILVAVLLLGLLVRVPFAAVDLHISADMDNYLRWGMFAREEGLPAVYALREAASPYPPLLLYLFSAAASFGVGNPAAIAVVKITATLCDLLVGMLISWVLWRRSPGMAALACALYLFNPAVWYVTVYWGQTDAIYTLFLLGAVLALDAQALVPAWAGYALAVGTKLQSMALAPLIAVWSLRRGATGKRLLGVAVGLGVWLVLASPWLTSGRVSDLIRIYTTPPEAPRVFVSAYNLWYLLYLGGVVPANSSEVIPSQLISYQGLGVGMFLLLAVLVLVPAVRFGWRPALPAAALSLGLFVLMTQMHERHLFPALVFLLLAAAQYTGDGTLSPIWRRAMWWAYGLLSLSFLFNLLTIAPFTMALGGNLVANILAGDSSEITAVLRWLSVVAALINVGMLAGLVVLMWKERDKWRVASDE